MLSLVGLRAVLWNELYAIEWSLLFWLETVSYPEILETRNIWEGLPKSENESAIFHFCFPYLFSIQCAFWVVFGKPSKYLWIFKLWCVWKKANKWQNESISSNISSPLAPSYLFAFSLAIDYGMWSSITVQYCVSVWLEPAQFNFINADALVNAALHNSERLMCVVCPLGFSIGKPFSKTLLQNVIPAITRIVLSLLCLQSVCRLHTEDDLHQCGRFHLPGSLRESPLHFTVAARPLTESWAPAWWRNSGGSISWRSTLFLWGPLHLHAAGPRKARNTWCSREESSRAWSLHSCSSVLLSLTAWAHTPVTNGSVLNGATPCPTSLASLLFNMYVWEPMSDVIKDYFYVLRWGLLIWFPIEGPVKLPICDFMIILMCNPYFSLS